MFRSSGRLLSAALAVLLGADGQAFGEDARLVGPTRALQAEASSIPRVVSIKKLLIRLPAGPSARALQSRWTCLGSDPASSAGRAFPTEGELEGVFREEISSNGYTVAGDPDALFDESPDPRPDFLVGGIVHDVRINACSSGLGIAPASLGKGEASLAVDWQVYSLRSRRVELSVASEGSARLGDGALDVFQQAFRAAARSLLADARLRELFTGPTAIAEPPTENTPMTVAFEAASSLSKASPEEMLSDARLCVVTVDAGDGFGSGFLISPDGYLLTSQHVVAGVRQVKVRFVTGREVNGEVVRANAARDVALVKLEKDRYRYLPLGNTSVLSPGTDVFAIGTPLSEDFGQTVTRGIVSGFGQDDGHRLIRSDVGIHKGNSGGPLLIKSGAVVGIAMGGVILMPMGIGVGLNSFVPIEEAIDALGLRNSESSRGSDVRVVSRETAIAR